MFIIYYVKFRLFVSNTSTFEYVCAMNTADDVHWIDVGT